VASVSALPHDAVVALIRAVDTHRAVIPARHLALVKRVCIQSVSFSHSLPDTQPGMVARSSAMLLLELASPQLDESIRADLARICEQISTGLVSGAPTPPSG
jgi:hypothetical protein